MGGIIYVISICERLCIHAYWIDGYMFVYRIGRQIRSIYGDGDDRKHYSRKLDISSTEDIDAVINTKMSSLRPLIRKVWIAIRPFSNDSNSERCNEATSLTTHLYEQYRDNSNKTILIHNKKRTGPIPGTDPSPHQHHQDLQAGPGYCDTTWTQFMVSKSTSYQNSGVKINTRSDNNTKMRRGQSKNVLNQGNKDSEDTLSIAIAQHDFNSVCNRTDKVITH